MNSFNLIRLSRTHKFLPFDCGDEDLNEFIVNDAKNYLAKLLAVTYLLEDGDKTVAFYCLSNDKIAIEDMDSKSQWNKLMAGSMPRQKQYKSYPAVKIGRLAINSAMQGKGIGAGLIDYIKENFVDNNKTGCMFITVDAYKDSVKFYIANGFKFLCPRKDALSNPNTRLMYYDLRELTS